MSELIVLTPDDDRLGKILPEKQLKYPKQSIDGTPVRNRISLNTKSIDAERFYVIRASDRKEYEVTVGAAVVVEEPKPVLKGKADAPAPTPPSPTNG